jgi:hypothetical protein
LPYNRTITTRIFATKQTEKFQVISRCHSIRIRNAVNKMLRESKSNQITGENYHLPLVTSLPLKPKNLQQTSHDNIRKKHNKQKPSPRSFSLNMYHSLSHNNLYRCLCLKTTAKSLPSLYVKGKISLYSPQHLKGQCHKIFCFWFFS